MTLKRKFSSLQETLSDVWKTFNTRNVIPSDSVVSILSAREASLVFATERAIVIFSEEHEVKRKEFGGDKVTCAVHHQPSKFVITATSSGTIHVTF